MKLTNNMCLPQTLVDAVTNDPYDSKGQISVTGLIQPPRLRQLSIRHFDELVEDVSDRVWMILGSNTHYILERAGHKNALQEERLSIDVNGWKVTGQADLYEDGVVSDWKITSVWSVINGVKDDWIQQLNLYSFLFHQNGFPVKALQIIALLRDWSKHQVAKSSNYPPAQVVVLPIELWSQDLIQAYLKVRITEHQMAESLPDDELPLCTPEERWLRPDKWAVKVKGQKRAKRVLDIEQEAQDWANSNMDKPYEIEHRPGEAVRCKSYCPVSEFCNQKEV